MHAFFYDCKIGDFDATRKPAEIRDFWLFPRLFRAICSTLKRENVATNRRYRRMRGKNARKPAMKPRASALDPATLERIMGGCAPADAVALSAALEPPWRARQRRLAARDQAVADAIRGHYPHLPLLTAARALSRALRAHLARRGEPGARDGLTACLERIASLNAGAEMGTRTIWDAAKNAGCGGIAPLLCWRDES